ncbi:MAG: helix-turn-helix domain-containing protein [Bacteroidia bacterium]|nr:helix-turn-helix domain-containing protein [Bacteroidia bacterium]
MLLNYILTLGGIQGLILSFIVYFKKPGFLANKFLAFFIFILGLGCLFDNNLHPLSLDLFIWVWAGNSLLLSPLLYLYISFSLNPRPVNPGILGHFLCFFLIKGLVIFVHVQNVYQDDTFIFLGTFLNYFLILYNLIYIGLSVKLLAADQRKRANQKLLALIKSLLGIFAAYNVLFFIRRIMSQFYLLEWSFLENYLYLGAAILIYLISVKIIYQPDFLYQKEKYAKSSLSKQDIEKYGLKIKDYFENQRIFVDPEFNLNRLSKDLALEKHKVSQILGDYFDASFYDLLNQYRIEEVCRQLLSSRHKNYSILGIAFDCGYQSKSSFNTAFKKIKGVTPSAFIRQQKNPH